LKELIDEIPVGAVNFNSVKSSKNCILRCLFEISNAGDDLTVGHLLRDDRVLRHTYCTRAQKRVRVHDGCAARGNKLAEDAAFSGVNGIGDYFPTRNLASVHNPGALGKPL